MERHLCAVPGCRVVIAETLLMCRADWIRVPMALRREVNERWRAFLATQKTRDKAAIVEAIAHWRSAREAAVEAVVGAE